MHSNQDIHSRLGGVSATESLISDLIPVQFIFSAYVLGREAEGVIIPNCHTVCFFCTDSRLILLTITS